MRKPRDIDSELKALQERARDLKSKRTTQFGELVGATGADTLPLEALAGVLLAAVEQAREKPEAVARWTERGQTFFRAGAGGDGKRASGGKRGKAGADTTGGAAAAKHAAGDAEPGAPAPDAGGADG